MHNILFTQKEQVRPVSILSLCTGAWAEKFALETGGVDGQFVALCDPKSSAKRVRFMNGLKDQSSCCHFDRASDVIAACGGEFKGKCNVHHKPCSLEDVEVDIVVA